ncbi:uncharacterized protein LOC113517365 [Galleria mellonella]|uniref:Uncharacterized protein LOC113517365 n=1 Tax=Galleria mellonella TaxID=7137 RepID=A0A6J1WQU7_GALME|nr:uncharacterized protein LOC113517365 [Galleria mellonella]
MKVLFFVALYFAKFHLIYSITVHQHRLEDNKSASGWISAEEYSIEGLDNVNIPLSPVICSDRRGSQACSGNTKSGNNVSETQVTKPPDYKILYEAAVQPTIRSQPSVERNTPWEIINRREANMANSVPMVAVGTYGGMQYLYAHPNLLASTNRFPPISNLPPVSSTHIHESLPVQDQQNGNFLSRPVRLIRSNEEEDFLAELSHRAIMKNILPTMSVRSPYVNQVPYYLPQVAVFPYTVTGCSLPLLLSCSPNINYGTLDQMMYRKPYKIPPPEKVYEKDVELKHAEVKDVDKTKSPIKHDNIMMQLMKSTTTKNPLENADHVKHNKFADSNLSEMKHTRTDILKGKHDPHDYKQLVFKQTGKNHTDKI